MESDMGARKGSLERGRFNHFETDEVNDLICAIVSEFRPGLTAGSHLVRRLAKALMTPGGDPVAIVGDSIPEEAAARLEALRAEIDPRFLGGKWLPPEPDQSCELIEITLAGGEWDEPDRVTFSVRFFDGKHRYFGGKEEVYASRLPLTAGGFLNGILAGRMGSGLGGPTQWDVYGDEIPWGRDGGSVYTEVLIDDSEWNEVFDDREDYGDFAAPWDAAEEEEEEDDEDEEDDGDDEDEDEAWEKEADADHAERIGLSPRGTDAAPRGPTTGA